MVLRSMHKDAKVREKIKKNSIPDSRFLIFDDRCAWVLSILLFSFLDVDDELTIILLVRVGDVKSECGKSKMAEGRKNAVWECGSIGGEGSVFVCIIGPCGFLLRVGGICVEGEGVRAIILRLGSRVGTVILDLLKGM